ncbi:hypothetical protein QFC22_004578 [Naganishia vaughanmartiniae]|uniref:Uncharacterized protein n=1 Tax=Naganishia vaughanmartiniae TaxID=1424756 RepID=A0ACC2WYP7_9TREE|nr:hypothetical protein QFC22_004578 [Naganishia vaughanmartiniae]
MSNNNTALLASAYQALGEELGSEKLKVVGGYTLGRVIGEGTYGSVHIATHRLTGTRCAVKKIPKALTAQLTREIHHHRLLHHSNILHLYEVLATENHIWLVSELCTGGELFDYLVERGRLLEGEARRIFGELVVAVGTMHRKGAVHRDLKLENVLLDGECQVKLGDLGFAREWARGQRLLETYCGTTGYASPEMLQGRKYAGGGESMQYVAVKRDAEVFTVAEADVWSLGIILYTLLCGGLPFDDDDEEVMKSLIYKGEYEEPEWLSEEAKDLIRNILQLEPVKRLSIEEILRHPWFNKTIIDPPLDSIPGAEGPLTPFLLSPDPTTPSFFSESTMNPTDRNLRHGVQLNESALSSTHVSPLQTPMKADTVRYIDTADTYVGPYGERHTFGSSNASDSASEDAASSVGVQGSENAMTSSTITTPSTPVIPDSSETQILHVQEEDHTDETPRRESIDRKLSYEHSNSSQNTIRKSEDSANLRQPLSATASKNRVQVLSQQREEDEDSPDAHSRRHSFVSFDEQAMHLPLAQHSRTPNRTKRRSVSSTLSDRRPSLLRRGSTSTQAPPIIDYYSQLNVVPLPFFSTEPEQELLASLRLIGLDVGQLQHSVNNNACDASSALWWMLRTKQKQRLDAASQEEFVTRTDDRPNGRTSPESRLKGSQIKDFSVNPERKSQLRMVELGAPVLTPDKIPATQPSSVKAGDTDQLPQSGDDATFLDNATPGFEQKHTRTRSTPKGPPAPNPQLGSSPAKEYSQAVLADIEALKPAENDALTSPNKKRDGNKTRTSSFNMLQRATSAFTTGSLTKKKSDEKLLEQVAAANHAGLEKSRSPKKLFNPPAKSRETSGAEDSDVPSSQALSTSSGRQPSPPNLSQSASHGTVQSLASIASSAVSMDDTPSKGQSGKARKRESLLTTFRSWFYEDKKGKRAPAPPMPTLHVANNAHVNRRPPSYQLPNSNSSKRSGPLRRTPSDQRPALHSRRSSSVNSRRSSVTSMLVTGMDLPVGSPLDTYGLIRRGSLGRRSAGSRTPTSERGSDFFVGGNSSRPSSVHSFTTTVKAPNPRHLETHSRAGSLRAHTPSRTTHSRSPGLSHYQRVTSSSPAGRSRHARFASSAPLPVSSGRAASTASSHRSNASSRRSSEDHSVQQMAEDAEDEADLPDDASIRSSRRKRTGHERYVYPSSRRIRSPHGSSTSLVSLGHAKPRPPIRDVFAKKRRHAGGLTDDDWVSEEEDGAYAGGLGQCSSNFGQCIQNANTTTKWKSGGGGSGCDTARNQDSPMLKGACYAPSSSHRSRAGTNRGESSRPKPSENITSTVPTPSQDWGRPTRSQLPIARPVRIIEEEEEEEEE